MEMTTGVGSNELYNPTIVVDFSYPKPLNATKTEARCQRDRRRETEHQHNEMSSSSGMKRGENTAEGGRRADTDKGEGDAAT